MKARVLQACLVLAVMSPVALVSPGCTVMGGSAEKAMAMLPENVKTAVSTYLGGMTDVNSLLSGITNVANAQSAIPKLVTGVNKLREANSVLGSLDSTTRGHAIKAFEPQLTQVHDGFTDQVARINSNKSLAMVIEPLLKEIKLFN